MNYFKLKRKEKARIIREELFLAMMEEALEENKEYNYYWPKECRPLNIADLEYISNRGGGKVIRDNVNGLEGVLINLVTDTVTLDEISKECVNNKNK